MKRPRIGINMNFTVQENDSSGSMSIPAPYIDSIWEAEGMPCLVPCPAPADCASWMEGLDGFLFIGGSDYPPELYGAAPHPEENLVHHRRSSADLALAIAVLKQAMPVMGICGGLQALNVALGGGLVQHVEKAESHVRLKPGVMNSHSAEIFRDSILEKVFGAGKITLNSSHHQAADPDRVGNGLKITARCHDGVIEALEGTGPGFILAVQWHPERMDAEHRSDIFGCFAQVCREYSEKKPNR